MKNVELTPAQKDAKQFTDWLGTFTTFDGALDAQGRRSRHLRRCRVMACAGMTLEEKADVYRAQKEFAPEMTLWA